MKKYYVSAIYKYGKSLRSHSVGEFETLAEAQKAGAAQLQGRAEYICSRVFKLMGEVRPQKIPVDFVEIPVSE